MRWLACYATDAIMSAHADRRDRQESCHCGWRKEQKSFWGSSESHTRVGGGTSPDDTVPLRNERPIKNWAFCVTRRAHQMIDNDRNLFKMKKKIPCPYLEFWAGESFLPAGKEAGRYRPTRSRLLSLLSLLTGTLCCKLRRLYIH